MTVPELIEAARDYYTKNPVGGSLHIVLDDGNLKDDSIKWCIDYARGEGDEEGAKLGEMILGASMTQRKKLYNSYSKYCGC